MNIFFTLISALIIVPFLSIGALILSNKLDYASNFYKHSFKNVLGTYYHNGYKIKATGKDEYTLFSPSGELLYKNSYLELVKIEGHLHSDGIPPSYYGDEN